MVGKIRIMATMPNRAGISMFAIRGIAAHGTTREHRSKNRIMHQHMKHNNNSKRAQNNNKVVHNKMKAAMAHNTTKTMTV